MKENKPNPDGAKKVVFSCVAEANSRFLTMALNLVRSIRWFGGRLSGAPIVVLVVGRIPSDWADRFARYEAETPSVLPWDPRAPYTNKFRMLELEGDHDILLALDCDTVVVGDLSGELRPHAVRAKGADMVRLTVSEFQELFALFGLPRPEPVYVASFTAEPTIRHHNSGVLMLPKEWVGLLLDSWAAYVERLLRLYPMIGSHSRCRNVAHRLLAWPRFVLRPVSERRLLWKMAWSSSLLDEYALTLALAQLQAPVEPLPLRCNMPVGTPLHPSVDPGDELPLILHYHRSWTSPGFIHRVGSSGVLRQIDRFNARLSAELGVPCPLAERCLSLDG